MPPNPPDASTTALLSALAAEYAAARAEDTARINGLAASVGALSDQVAAVLGRLAEHDAVLTKRGQSEADLYRLVDALGTKVIGHKGGIERLDGLAQETIDHRIVADKAHAALVGSMEALRRDLGALRVAQRDTAALVDEHVVKVDDAVAALRTGADQGYQHGQLLRSMVDALFTDQATLTQRLNELSAAPVATPADLEGLRKHVTHSTDLWAAQHAALAGEVHSQAAVQQTFVKSLDAVAHDGQDTDSRVTDAFDALDALRAAVQKLPTKEERAASDAVLAAMGLRLDRLSDELATAGASGSLVTAAGKGYMMHTGHEHTPRLYLVSTFAQNGALVRVYRCRECAFQEAYELPVEGAQALVPRDA